MFQCGKFVPTRVGKGQGAVDRLFQTGSRSDPGRVSSGRALAELLLERQDAVIVECQ